MTDAELLAKIKTGLSITGAYQDNTLNLYIDEVKEFMLSAGVKLPVVNSSASVGCIVRGVADLWNLSSGNATFSDYFLKRMMQLAAMIERTETVKTEASVYNVTFALFILPRSIVSVSVNGIEKTQTTDYTISGQTLTFTNRLPTNSTVTIKAYD